MNFRRARALLGAVIACLLATTSCAPPDSGPRGGAIDPSADRAAVLAAHQKLFAAMETGDSRGFVELLDDDPAFAIFHPRLRSEFDAEDLSDGSLEGMICRLAGAQWSEVDVEVAVAGDVAWIRSHLLIESPSMTSAFLGRGTEVWVRQGERWRLRHGHWSEAPGE